MLSAFAGLVLFSSLGIAPLFVLAISAVVFVLCSKCIDIEETYEFIDAKKNETLWTNVKVGNGLRPDLWDCFRNRFGVKRIVEIYGASEGNALFMNLLNKDETIGMTNAKVRIFKYDVAEDKLKTDENGKYIEVEEHQPGLALVKIGPNAVYNGYTDKKARQSSCYRYK